MRSGLGRALCVLGLLLISQPSLAAHHAWIEVRSPHFVIVSNAGEKGAIEADVRLEQIRTVFRETIPVATGANKPIITVFAVKGEDSMRELLPEYWATGHVRPAGIFFSWIEQSYAAVALDPPGENPYEPMYHEYFHSLSQDYPFPMPLWISEGLAEFFGNTIITDGQAYMGQPRDEFIQQLRQGRLIPLDVLFAADRSSAYYNDKQLSSEFYAECWALTHYLMIADRGAHRRLLDDYIDAIEHGTSQQAATAKAFADLPALQQALQRYLKNFEFYPYVVPAPDAIALSDLKVRALSNAEIDAQRGGFEAARGQSAAAMPLLQEAVRLDPTLVLGYRNLALAQLFAGQQSAAMASLARAISIDPKNALCRYLRAYLNVMQHGAILRDPGLENDLRESVASDPDFAPASALLAVYVSLNPTELQEALSLARRAVTLHPSTSDFRVALAQVLMRMRRFDDAQVELQNARSMARTPAERAEASQLYAVLQTARRSEQGVAATSGGTETTATGSSTPGDSSPGAGAENLRTSVPAPVAPQF